MNSSSAIQVAAGIRPLLEKLIKIKQCRIRTHYFYYLGTPYSIMPFKDMQCSYLEEPAKLGYLGIARNMFFSV